MSLKQVPEETSHANMLVFLLLRYPQIFTINYNLAKDLFRISFMLKIKLDNERYIKFKKSFSECMHFYKNMAGVASSPRINRRNIDDRTLLQVTWKNDHISIEEVNLVSSLVLKEFYKDLIIETREESIIWRNTNEAEERYELWPQRKRENEENLFAFRESGRVYIYDK